MDIDIPDEVANRLKTLAEQEGTSVGDILTTLLDDYKKQPRAGSLAMLAQNAREANLASAQPVDTAERSRDILNQEYADYLKRRMEYDGDNHNR